MSDSCDPVNCSPPGSSVHEILQAHTTNLPKLENVRYTPLQVFATFWRKKVLFREYLFAEIFAFVPDICLGKVFRREIAGFKVIYMFKVFNTYFQINLWQR